MRDKSLSQRTHTNTMINEMAGATPLGTSGIAANSVALFNPSAGNGGNPPVGFSWNAHYPQSPVDFGVMIVVDT